MNFPRRLLSDGVFSAIIVKKQKKYEKNTVFPFIAQRIIAFFWRFALICGERRSFLLVSTQARAPFLRIFAPRYSGMDSKDQQTKQKSQEKATEDSKQKEQGRRTSGDLSFGMWKRVFLENTVCLDEHILAAAARVYLAAKHKIGFVEIVTVSGPKNDHLLLCPFDQHAGASLIRMVFH